MPTMTSTRAFSQQQFEAFLATGEIPENHRVTYRGGQAALSGGAIVLEQPVVVIEQVVESTIQVVDDQQWDERTSLATQIKQSFSDAMRAIVPPTRAPSGSGIRHSPPLSRSRKTRPRVKDVAYRPLAAGSIRIPSSYCGTYGMKGTFGLVPYTGACSLETTIDHCGPITNNVADNALLLETAKRIAASRASRRASGRTTSRCPSGSRTDSDQPVSA